jgi:hypothetical protein
MQVDIFIRTYHKDLPWLEHALRSIHKHVTGHRRIIVAIPEGQGHLLAHLTAETVIEVPDLEDGYLGQQLTKMEAWKCTDADCVLFWDSDVVAKEPIDIHAEYFKDGKPILYKTRYSSIPGTPWQGVTEKALDISVGWEYMRRMPIIHLSDVLKETMDLIEETHGLSMRTYLDAQPHKAFSEFNVIGAVADLLHRDSYTIIDTESIDMPPNKVAQFWSWGGITNEVRQQLGRI